MKRTKNRLNPQPKPVKAGVLYMDINPPGRLWLWMGDKWRVLLDHEQAMIRRELTGVNERPCGKT